MKVIHKVIQTSVAMFPRQPLVWNLFAALGTIWTGNKLIGLGSFTWLHFLRRSSLDRYKSESPWALVTGSSDGIGKAFAQELCHRGFNVILHGRNEEKLQAVRAELIAEWPQQEVRILVLDVAESAGNHDLLDAAVEQLGDLDLKVLINNVGGGARRLWIPLQEYEQDGIRLFLDMNCRFQAELTKLLLPRLIERSPALIMNIGSFVSELPAPYITVFGGAKAFGKAWSRSLHFEMLAEGHDVEVMQVQVGMVSTSNEPRPESVFVPNARRLAQSSLDKVGSGRSIVFGYWPHELHCRLLVDLPALFRDRMLMRIVKGPTHQATDSHGFSDLYVIVVATMPPGYDTTLPCYSGWDTMDKRRSWLLPTVMVQTHHESQGRVDRSKKTVGIAMKLTNFTPVAALLPPALALSSTRPFTAPIVTPAPSATTHAAANAASSQVPANTNGPKAPRNVVFVAYAYDDQWDGTNTSMPAIDVDNLYQDMTGVDTLVINPCDVSEQDPAVPHCHGWPFINSTYWEQIWPSYQSVQSNGILLIASYGGYGSNTFELLGQDWSTYYPPIVNMLKTYKFDGIDFDIEPSSDGYVPPRSLALQLVTSIRSDMGQEFIITFTPVSSDLYQTGGSSYSGFSSWQLDQEATATGSDGTVMKSINWFTPQFYSGGGTASAESYESIISNGEWDPTRVVMLAAGSQAASGWVNITTLEGIAQQLTANYGDGNFGGIGGYEYARAGESDGISNWQWFKDLSQAQDIATS